MARVSTTTRTTTPTLRPRVPRGGVRSYVFRVVVEPDGKAWHAYCPTLKKWGAATWGKTKGEALRHIHEVVRMVVDELAEEDIPIPEGPEKDVSVSLEPRVAVTVTHGD